MLPVMPRQLHVLAASLFFCAGPAVAQVTSTSDWQSFPLAEQTGIFVVELDITPNGDNIDGVTGFANGTITDYNDTPVALRFNTQGTIDAIDGNWYGQANTISYSTGVTYGFRIVVRIPSSDFSAYVTPAGRSEQALAINHSFRAEQPTVPSIDTWGLIGEVGSYEVSGMTVTHSGPLAGYTLQRAAAPPDIDGDPTELEGAAPIVLTHGSTGTVATYRLLWDDRALYLGMSVSDEHLNAVGQTATDSLWSDDGLEIMFDVDHNHGGWRRSDDRKLLINIHNVHSATAGTDRLDVPINSRVLLNGSANDDGDTDVGYTLELEILWADWGFGPPAPGDVWGLEIKANDRVGTDDN